MSRASCFALAERDAYRYPHGSFVKAQRHPISHHCHIIIAHIIQLLHIIYIQLYAIAAVTMIRATSEHWGRWHNDSVGT
jgi:hypothetical protein